MSCEVTSCVASVRCPVSDLIMKTVLELEGRAYW